MLKRFPWKPLLLGLLVVLAVALGYIFWPERADVSALKDAGAQYTGAVRILRDTWGVPHIFGKTDAAAAFGLAYAHAEDDFKTIQQGVLAARGRLATVYGLDSAPIDYSVRLLRIWEVVDAHYDTLRPETRAVLDAYVAGINRYAARHPDEVLSAEIFPVTGEDVIAAFVQKSPLFFGLDGTLSQFGLCSGQGPRALSAAQTASYGLPDSRQGAGSNVLAVGPSRTADGSTFLAVNSHQPWTGPVAWYEAHIHSEEGWDMVGGTFPGTPAILHGHNRNLGWAFTVNHPDLIDVYALTINPENPAQYRFDGGWKEFEASQAPITVKIAGRLKITVNQPVLWSIHGPVMCKDGQYYAIRYAGFGRVDMFEQIYQMNKAVNFKEWQDAVRRLAVPAFNVGYADKDGNVYYLYNGDLPVRADGYDWQQTLPGDTPATVWTGYLPLEQLPQVLNPPAGFIQNSNSTPFQTTLGAGNPDPQTFPASLGIETFMTNRALRSLELFGADESITFEEFKTYKYDMAYAASSDIARYVEQIVNGPPAGTPDAAVGIDLLRRWDRRTDPENTGAALAVLTLHYLSEANDDLRPSALIGAEVDQAQLLASFQKAIETLKKHFGRLDVPWREVNRLRRGHVDLGLGGGPDILHAVYGELQDDGRLSGVAGDSYVLLVRWDKMGKVESYSIHQFGSATLNAQSAHYADQAPLFVERNLKPVWLDEADIRAHLEREYEP